MKFCDWIKEKGLTKVEVAGLLHVSPAAVSRWSKYNALPEKAYVELIFLVTRGRVRPDDFYNLAKLADDFDLTIEDQDDKASREPEAA